jgi:asparagine synthase (glutamine-hydrolysing)
MCGIFGHTIKDKISLEISILSLNTLKHRGPDQQNNFVDEKVFLGHRRLSILDLSENGKQPMQTLQTVITVNGEIYNFRELRSELEGKYQFKSNSDSEVILYGYEEWGLATLLEKIDGMYAFVIYDKKERKIYIARDRYGIKPLFYSLKNGQLCWGSELKALTTFLGNENLEIDNTALYDYLTYLYIPTPKTLYNDIKKLPPAHYLTYDLNADSSMLKRYWELPTKEIDTTIETASEKVREYISKSVKEQMISDVPIGFFLSGGIDSSIIVSEASNHSKNINTYSIGFDVEEHNETKYAKIISTIFHTNHHEAILKSKDANDLESKLVAWFDEPFADTSAFPTYLVSSFAKRSSTVVLTGDGGDELFGGYDWYDRFYSYKKKQIGFLTFLKRPISKLKTKFRYTYIGRAANQMEYRICDDLELYAKLLGGLLKHEKEHYRKKWNIPKDYNDYWYFEKFYNTDLSPKKRLQYLDFHTYLHDDIFTKVDRTSMAVSLECRVPFMKKELVEYAFSLPQDIVFSNSQLKGLLKVAYKNILPREILYRKKKGFSIPLKQWNKKFLKEFSTQQERILDLFEL